MLTHAQLLEELTYDPESGHFHWRKPGPRRTMSKPAGCVTEKGYRRIGVLRQVHKAHRLAFFYMTGHWPTHGIDHINSCPDDNRWKNLRAATHQQNMYNKRTRKDSSSGYKGVTLDKVTRRWSATITISGTKKHLGYFATPEEAHSSYKTAALKFHGSFARW